MRKEKKVAVAYAQASVKDAASYLIDRFTNTAYSAARALQENFHETHQNGDAQRMGLVAEEILRMSKTPAQICGRIYCSGTFQKVCDRKAGHEGPCSGNI